MQTVGSIGETALIERLAARVRSAGLAQPSGAQVVLGIGDDAAAWRMDGIEASSIDTMVEGVHFRTATASWADIGWKAWVSNVSDMAAMGAEPVAGLIALGLPAELAVEDVDALYDGMLEACAAYGTLLLGGDIVGSPVVFVTVAMTGRCEDAPLTRDAARVGDAVAVTGPLGASRGGLLLLEEGRALDSPAREHLALAHRRPTARPDIGLMLRRFGVRCAMDISDGLAADLPKLTRAAGLAARVSVPSVPVSPALRTEFGGNALPLALAGGEDYELLFAGTPEAVHAALAEIPAGAVIGEIVEGEPGRVEFIGDEGAVDLNVTGWEHLR